MIKRYMIALMAMAILIGGISISPVKAQAISFTYIIDFEQGFNEGDIVSSLSCTQGISCPSGGPDVTVLVNGRNQAFPNSNTAMIFDAECLPGGIASDCSGEDDDLLFPGHGNTLINSEDLVSSDPDDQDQTNSFMEFDFNGIPGNVTIDSIDVGDIEVREDGAYAEFHHDICPGHPNPIDDDIRHPFPITGDHVIQTELLGVEDGFSGTGCLHVHLNGSGTIDNIQFTITDTPRPAIEIEKATNGEDADRPTGPVVPVHSQVDFTYVVTNTGSEDLTNVVVTDDQGVEVACPQDTLAVGESMTCTGSTIATAGQYANIGEACGDGAEREVCDTDPSHHFGADPDIDIEKATNGPGQDPQDADDPNDGPKIAPGDEVTWTYTVENTGNVPFNQADVRVVDETIGPVTRLVGKTNGNNNNVLEPGEIWIYEATGVALDLSKDQGETIIIVEGCGATPPQPTYQNLGVVTAPGGAIDKDLSHYCNPPASAPVPAMARITGGGWRVTASNGETIRSSGGFTLHCDITLSNNLQINWDKGQKWHINKLVDAAFCLDDPAYTPGPPRAPADTYIGLDEGRLNNKDGSVACFRLEDHGEIANDPDGPDRAMIRIWDVGFDPEITAEDLGDPEFDCLVSESDPADDEHTVLYVPLSDIQGNFQFHEDQPHKNGNGQGNR